MDKEYLVESNHDRKNTDKQQQIASPSLWSFLPQTYAYMSGQLESKFVSRCVCESKWLFVCAYSCDELMTCPGGHPAFTL